MFASVKLLIKEFKTLIVKKDWLSILKENIKSLKLFVQQKNNQLRNLFATNLDNGLNNLYRGYYRDAWLRFVIMNFFWKKNCIVYYNLARVYFYQSNYKKSLLFFENSIKLFEALQNTSHHIDVNIIKHYIKKINNESDIIYVPVDLKREFYDYTSMNCLENIFAYARFLQDLQAIFNHYIWVYQQKKNIEKLNFLEIGCQLGELGVVLRKNYPQAILHGIDFSKKNLEIMDKIQQEQYNEKIYDYVELSEMHSFLSDYLSDLKSQEKQEVENKLFDVIFSMGTFGDFGQMGVIIKLCELSLQKDGLLIFYVYEGEEQKLQFSVFKDYFSYNVSYIESTIKQTSFNIDFIDNNIKYDGKKIILVILRKMK